MSQIKTLPCSLLTENMQITLLLFEMFDEFGIKRESKSNGIKFHYYSHMLVLNILNQFCGNHIQILSF